MKSFTKHTVLEKRVRHSLYATIALASLAAILGVISLIMPSGLPESAITIPAVLAVTLGYYAVGLKDADATIYKSRNSEQAKEGEIIQGQ
jgi:hypothetical protein